MKSGSGFRWVFKSSPSCPAWRVTRSPVRAPGEAAVAQACGRPRKPGRPHSQPAPAGSSRASRTHHPRGTCLSGGQPGLLARCHLLPTLVFSWSCCYLQFGFQLQTALPEGPLRRPVSTVRSGWVVQGWAGGCCPSSLPSASSSFGAVAAASRGDPDGHTSSVCWSPPTRHGSAEQTHRQLPPPTPVKWQEE